ncbi:BglG family transcription antiterminator [Pectinatus cerevisiiphilus]|uniref:Transcriptional antiterminator n=1 Tax=Pectinatus cerevisiiphilus TaxID=86956 RepID=A0A4R3KCR3_9FIRM|nr:PTS sugar transporter subunit IIA [Pectinatus cerevisiiphilus]TCS81024.1 transcriptional antiterminator [Pectinatus cerevisiiphilus]
MIYSDGGKNMKLVRRQVNLIKCIIENPKVGIKELGKTMNVSMQTVKSDLQNIKGFMKDHDVTIEILPGNQLCIYGIENMPYVLKISELMLEFSLEKQIILMMLFNDSFVVLQDMADTLYVSKSLIEKIMASLLKKYPEELQSTRHHGIRSIASQIEKRSRFVEVMEPYVQGINFTKELKQFHVRHFPILQYIIPEYIIKGMKALHYLQSISAFIFTDEAICQFFLQIIYIQFCQRSKKTVYIETAFFDIIHGMQGEKEYLAVAKTICSILQIYDTNEQNYLCYLFMTLRKQKISDSTKFVREMRDVVGEIFRKIFERMSIDFNADQELMKGLSVHIYTTVLRRDLLKKFSLDYSWHDIKHQYPLGFEMAAVTAEVISSRFMYKPSNDEMTYLTLHFQAAIERMKNGEKKLRILVVCHYGMAAASLIAAKIERIFHMVEIADTISMQHFFQMKSFDADLVLSTENIEAKTIPVIYITPLLTQNELKQIRYFIEMHCINNLLALSIMHAAVIDVKDIRSRNEAIKIAATSLYKDKLVTENYLESVIERENISSTDIELIAIPHGNPDFVRESKLVILRLQEPVHWEISDVSYVFMFAVSKEQFMANFALFSTFYKKMVRSNIRTEIKKFGREDTKKFKKSLAHLLSL